MDFDVVWGRVVRVTSFVAGMAIMAFETLADKSDRPWLYAAAVGMMGLPIARAAENVLGKIGGSDKPQPALPDKAPPPPAGSA